MMARLRHRGPDGSGYFRSKNVLLGHTRLSIVDVEGGAQPMSNEDGSVWITYNGEIYNAPELRQDLEARGHVFRTECDTEVAIHAFEEWDTGCFERFNGQWAAALWNERSRRLLLSRDRVGIRPLYYTVAAGRLLFASEIKALFADPQVRRRPDPAGFRETLTFWSPVAPRTAFDGVFQVPAGHFVDSARLPRGAGTPSAPRLVDRHTVKSEPFWELTFPPKGLETGTEAENAEALRQHLVRSAKTRFTRSDVPVGAFISGGIDSSVIAAILAQHTEIPLTTFSIRFEHSQFDEGSYQKEVTDALGSTHRELRVTRSQIGEVFPEVIRHAERPILRTAPAPLFLLSRLVRDSGFKVVVTGEGADEVLGGYDIFREAKIREFIARDTSSEERIRIVEKLYPWMEQTKAAGFTRAFFAKQLDPDDPGLSHRPRWSAGPALARVFDPDFVAESSSVSVESDLLGQMPAESTQWDGLSRAQWIEIKTLLEPYILSAQGDRMLMAHSVEGRFPFLDHELVDLASRMPGRHKLMGLNEKHLLKRIASDLVPKSVLNRPKQPYRSPDASSFLGDQEPSWMAAILSDDSIRRSGLIAAKAGPTLLEKARRMAGQPMSNTDNMRIVAIVSTALWYQEFITKDGGDEQEPPQPMIVIDRSEQ